MAIVIVDDDAFALKLLTRQLAMLGEQDVTCFERARDALDLFANGAGEGTLVFCDLQMPDMDGVEFVRHLTSGGFKGSLVLVSGEDERILQTAALLAKSHRLNILGTLSKPSTADLLKPFLERHRAAGDVQAGTVVRSARKSYSADDVRLAIAERQLTCHFQPKVALATGEVVGAESLVRWQHPTDGLIYPDQFVPLAEELGLIGGITRAVMNAALSQARAWRDAGLDLCVSVNVSMDDLVSLDFPEQVALALDTAGMTPDRLILEVTETRLMKDRLAALDILTRLRLRRIGLSIDDFGTGHSSLVQLRDMPFTELKIDQGFVTGAYRDPSRRAMFEACRRLGHELGLKIAAEGAEDLDDWNFLRDSGCDIVQGYFVARPMPGPDMQDWIATWAHRYESLLFPAAEAH